MFIINLNYIKPLKEIDKLRDEHVQFLKKYYADGLFLMSGPKAPRTGGIIIAGRATKAELETIIQEDPFWREKAAEYEILEFNASMSAENYASFFE